MTATCPTCHHVHTTRDAYAVGRFDPHGPTGYRAATAGTPPRATRAEAIADECRARAGRSA